MVPRITRNILAAVVAVLGATACDHPTGPSPRADLLPTLPLPVQGTLAVATLTTGSSVPSGYTVTVDNSQSQAIARDRHAIDKIRVTMECADFAAQLEIPNLQSFVSRGGDEPWLARARRNIEDDVGMPREPLEFPAGFQIPHSQ